MKNYLLQLLGLGISVESLIEKSSKVLKTFTQVVEELKVINTKATEEIVNGEIVKEVLKDRLSELEIEEGMYNAIITRNASKISSIEAFLE